MAFVIPEIAVIKSGGAVEGFSLDNIDIQSVFDNQTSDDDIVVLYPGDYRNETFTVPLNAYLLIMPGALVDYKSGYKTNDINNRYSDISGEIGNITDLNLSDTWQLTDIDSTDDLSEGVSNLYFTKSRVNDVIQAGSGISLSFDGTNTTITNTQTIPDTYNGWRISASSSGTGSLVEENDIIRFVDDDLDPSLASSYDAGTKTWSIRHVINGPNNTSNSGRTYIQNLDFDTHGHVIDVEVSTVDPQFTFDVAGDSGTNETVAINDLIQIKNAGATSSLSVDLTTSSGQKEFTIDHDVSAGTSSTGNSGRNYIQNIQIDDNGHVESITANNVPESFISISVGESTTSLDTFGSGDALLIDEQAGSPITVTYSNPQPPLRQFEISHDTSSATDSTNSGKDFIQNINVDGYGHIESISSATIPDTDYYDIGDYLENPVDTVIFGYLVPRAIEFTSGSAYLGTPSSTSLQLQIKKNGVNTATISIAAGSNTSTTSGFPFTVAVDDRLEIESSGATDGVDLYYNVAGEIQ